MIQTISTTDRLEGAFRQALGLSTDCDFSSVAYGSTPGWDSVAHMSLVAEIEMAFDIMLDTDDVIAMSSYSQALEIIAKYGVAVGE